MFVVTVPSADKSKTYTVRKVAEGVWTCDCQDHVNRSHGEKYCCKHVADLAVSLAGFVSVAKMSKKAQEVLSA